MTYGKALEEARVGLRKLNDITNADIIQAANCIYTTDIAVRKIEAFWQGDQYGRAGIKGVKDLVSEVIKVLKNF